MELEQEQKIKIQKQRHGSRVSLHSAGPGTSPPGKRRARESTPGENSRCACDVLGHHICVVVVAVGCVVDVVRAVGQR